MWHEATAYLKYKIKAQDAHGLHSPFVFSLYNEVIAAHDKHYYKFDELEGLRWELLNNQREVEVTDFGAGSRIFKTNRRKIADVAKYCLGSSKEGQFLFRLINFMRPQVLLELGTSLGLNTMYQSFPNSQAKVYTFEGCPNTAAVAQEYFQKVGISPQVIVGNLDITLKDTVATLPAIDYVFFDANHQYEPTVQYFLTCLEKAHENTVFIFDDIHWSAGMEKAWAEIKQHPRVTLSIDLFQLGLVFFREKQPKQHFVLKF